MVSGIQASTRPGIPRRIALPRALPIVGTAEQPVQDDAGAGPHWLCVGGARHVPGVQFQGAQVAGWLCRHARYWATALARPTYKASANQGMPNADFGQRLGHRLTREGPEGFAQVQVVACIHAEAGNEWAKAADWAIRRSAAWSPTSEVVATAKGSVYNSMRSAPDFRGGFGFLGFGPFSMKMRRSNAGSLERKVQEHVTAACCRCWVTVPAGVARQAHQGGRAPSVTWSGLYFAAPAPRSRSLGIAFDVELRVTRPVSGRVRRRR